MDRSNILARISRQQMNAAPSSGMGRQRPARQNHGSPTFVNFHFDFRDFVPVNS
jgi:hypothetical protein